ncbi:MAG: MBL fold metallo-hydrolase [Spirochaetales bacterium]|nr:MBL fold metallo-hydrolase [Spirochaetales bacterium]
MSNNFKVVEIARKTWAIIDLSRGNGVNTFLLEGDDCSLLIDSGYGINDISRVCSSLTNKKVICVCTHGHIDHAMGARFFSESYLHSNDFDVYRMSERIAGLEHHEVAPINNIPKFDLGGRVVTWKLFPGHTPGSIVFLDSLTHFLFDGDAEQPSQWLFMDESSDIATYRANLLDNIEWMKTAGVTYRFCGHADPSSPLDTDLSNLVACADKIIEQTESYSRHSIRLGDHEVPVKLYGYENYSIYYRI